MPTNSLFDGAISTLQKSLNLGSLRHKVLTANIANIDTPNYKAFEVVMQNEIKKNGRPAHPINLVRTQPDHLLGRNQSATDVKLKVADPPPLNFRADGNTVDLDKTMGKLAENTLLYRAAAQIIKRKFQGLKNVIQGGGK
ncbi:MAG: flagellar basal body rod protein FlgB [Desulfobacterales bacterium]|jgi:flagellar basal-body rod protein FlgB